MKIVHFISSLEQGGAQAVLYQLVSKLNEYEHHVMYIHDGPYKKRFEQLGIPLYQVSLYTPFKLVRLLKQLKPDCIHTSLWVANWLGRIAAWRLQIPCISSLHNHANINGFVRNTLDRLAPSATAMIAVSRDVQESFGYAQCCVIHNGVAKFSGALKAKQDLGLEEKHFVIGSVGRFHSDKQYDLLINAFALVASEFDHVRLVLMGAGAQEKKLRTLVSFLKLEHKVVFIIGESAASYYALFDCFVLTSKSEGVSMALLEAMSNGVVPIIAHACYAHPVIEHGKNGFLVSHDKYMIAETIKRTMSQPVRASMHKAVQETIATGFSDQQMIAAYDNCFRQTIV